MRYTGTYVVVVWRKRNGGAIRVKVKVGQGRRDALYVLEALGSGWLSGRSPDRGIDWYVRWGHIE